MSEDRGRPNDWTAKHAAIDAAARAIIGEEAAVRDAKTAKLKALREAREASEAKTAPKPRQAAAKGTKQRARPRG